MKKLTVSKKTNGEYKSDVAFCLMEGGHSETQNTDVTVTPKKVTWTVADELKDGGVLIREMSISEYKKYKHETNNKNTRR